MTTYNYLSEMQELCFRAMMALSVTKDKGMEDFYLAANEGFFLRMDEITKEEAEKTITQSQLEQYLRTQDFVEQKEKEAAEILAKDKKEPEAEVCENQKVLY